MWLWLQLRLFRLYFVPVRYIRYWWSVAYRKLWGTRYQQWATTSQGSRVPFGKLTPEEAQKEMRLLKWRPDGLKELGDAVGSAERTHWFLEHVKSGAPQPEHEAMDCDDFAAWAEAVIKPEFEPRVFTFTYVRQGKLAGHAVCVYKKAGKWFHCGNWGIYGPAYTLAALTQMSLRASGGKMLELKGWCLYKEGGLAPAKWGYNLPQIEE